MPFALPLRLRRIAIAGLTALILAAPAAITRAHEFEPGDDHGGLVVATSPTFPSGVSIVAPIGGPLDDDHGLHAEPGDDHGQDS
jgi:hypothetical protein